MGVLRTDDSDGRASDAWTAYSMLLSDALRKAPQVPLNGNCRGVSHGPPKKVYGDIKVGDKITDRAFTSTSNKLSVAQQFAGEGTLMIYKAVTSTGADVKEWS